MVLRLSPSLWNEIAKWAEEDFRSINGQVEYLLSQCVNERRKKR
ncbi:MAG TPA: Arc family DNA-binding protein [Candidatus Copromorpha excrementigallinarum]|uniref:Arc family DNA-binding protein n=1 Tax=Candidatus Allocopromorpha excrementigallinarum TaxID=2840742 RepID=A0A9D1I3M2_9FIRM|nr:Arc family DNA-binding protein [Candidatus Copromorpha excrementigallinarum]